MKLLGTRYVKNSKEDIYKNILCKICSLVKNKKKISKNTIKARDNFSEIRICALLFLRYLKNEFLYQCKPDS